MKDSDVRASVQGFSVAVISVGKGNTLPTTSHLKFSQNKWAPFGSFNYDSDCIHWSWGTILSQFVFIIIYAYNTSPLKIIYLFVTTVITASLYIKLFSIWTTEKLMNRETSCWKQNLRPCFRVLENTGISTRFKALTWILC